MGADHQEQGDEATPKIEKGPACRQADESYDECVSRKIPELIEIDGMDQDQAVAVARSMCETKCSEKSKSLSKQVTDQVREALKKKAEDHNEKVGNAKTKRTTTRTLGSVFLRGIGAYSTNPSSVRPSVNSAEQWAYARVNSFLYCLRNGRFRSGKHDTDLLPKGHPQSTKSIDTNTINKRTDFPAKGDDKKVSLRNSKWPIFPSGYAADLKSDWPKIWGKGGNILGNTQYARLTKVLSQGGSPKTPTDEKAIRLREAWMARHYRDHRLAGVVAQIKWLGIGSRGLDHMKKVINDEKARLRKSANREEPQ